MNHIVPFMKYEPARLGWLIFQRSDEHMTPAVASKRRIQVTVIDLFSLQAGGV
jgi:hypothetical protein